MDKLSPENTETEAPGRYAEIGFAPVQQRTRRDFAILGAQVFGGGAGIATLIFAVAKIFFDFKHYNKQLHLNLFHLFLFAYCAIPISGAFGALIAYRAYAYALKKKVPSISILAWIGIIWFLTWFAIIIYFTHSVRQNVLEKDERSLTSAVVYFTIAVMMALLAAGTREMGFMINIYTVLAMWCCCDTLVVNMLRTYRNDGQLAPLTTQKFQFSLGTLFCVIFGSAAWVTGLVTMLK